MKRYLALFFAIAVLQLFFIGSASAATYLSTLSLSPIVDGDGYTNIGDTVRVEAIATYTAPTTAWIIAPYVDCANFGLGQFSMNLVNATTGLYRADVVLSQPVDALNYINTPALTDVTVGCQSTTDTLSNQTNSILVDLAQVDGQSPTVSPAVVANGQDITISITDNRYQSAPNGGTKATVDLTPIGGVNNVAVPYTGAGGLFRLTLDATTQLYLVNKEYTGPLSISLKDPLNPIQTFISNDFILDTRPPVVDTVTTKVEIVSGNTTALDGDVLRLTAAVSQFDGETASVTIPLLTSGATPATINTGLDFGAPISSAGDGNPAVWQTTVNLSTGQIKDDAMLVTFTFKDDSGNVNRIDKIFKIDLDKPAFNYLNANILYPDGSDSPWNVATTTCSLEIVASIPINVTPDTLTVKVDLSPIGGPVDQDMAVSPTGEYKFVYPIVAGSIEDTANHTFQVSAVDGAGNTVLQSTTPAIQIDNVQPTISNVTITSAEAIVLSGDQFTITADATNLETGSVTVDLSSIGQSPFSPLTFQSGTTYAGTFTLNASGGAIPFVAGARSFPVTARDILAPPNAALLAHAIASSTPTHRFYNGNLVLNADVFYPNGTDSPYTVATTSCKLQITATVPITGTIAPLTATVDLSSIGGPAALAMPKVSGTDNYVATYTIPAGSLEDNVAHTFLVTVLDKNSEQIVKNSTSPAITIDNTLPVINSATLSNSDANISVGDIFTITVSTTGVENGSVTVDLSALGSSTNTILPLTTPNTYSSTFVLADSIAAGIVRDGTTFFKVTISDTAVAGGSDALAHLVSANTNSMMIDNEPPFIVGVGTNSYHLVNPTIDDGFVRIQDFLSFHVNLASASTATGEFSSLQINMLPLGQPATSNMTASASNSGWYDYVLPGGVATGTINRSPASFTITATDNAGNATSTIIAIPIDNQPITINDFIIDASVNKPGRTDSVSGTINFNKIVSFKIPYSTYSVDHATATIDLSAIGQGASVLMASDTASYSYLIDTASTTSEFGSHIFNAMIYDLSGNSSLATSNAYKVDCQIPEVLGATATIEAGVQPLGIGDEIKISARVLYNEGVAPTVNLSAIGGSANQPLVDTGSGLYAYTTLIGTGSYDETSNPLTSAASFTITFWDNDQNYATASTNVLTIDNTPPESIGNLTVALVPADGSIKVGDPVTFQISISNTSNPGTATIDLSPIGFTTSEQMTYNGLGTYTLNVTSAIATQSFIDYKFKAKLTDKNDNLIIVESAKIAKVDCQPASFTTPGILISTTNNDNPIATVANINDVITVYASASPYLDLAMIHATIGSGSVDFATATMNFNASTNRHEAVFTVGAPGTANWGILDNNTLDFKLTATDTIGNVSTMVTGTSVFTVRNIPPAISISSFTLNPDYLAQTAGPLPVYNVGSSTSGDLLFGYVKVASSVPILNAWLDFASVASGQVALTVTGDSATSTVGVKASALPPVDYEEKDILITVQDQAGNKVSASQTFIIDNVFPKITSANFNGATLTVNLSEEYETGSIDTDQLKIVGSNTLPLDFEVNLSLATAIVSDGLFSFDISLTLAQQKAIAQWASTPIYLQVAHTKTTAPLTDRAGNWLPTVNYHPINITDSSWREAGRITQFTMVQNWPAPTKINLYFSKNMDRDSLIASNAVLITSPLTYDFTDIDYTTGYIFNATDSVNWVDDSHLEITLNASATYWVAKKLTNNTSTKLMFATRSSAHVFLRDPLDRAMANVPTSAPIAALDNRPVAGFSINGPALEPIIDMSSQTLAFSTTDEMLLFANDFKTLNATGPELIMPVPSLSKAVTTFHNQISLYDIDAGTNTVLQLKDLEIPSDNRVATNTLVLKLTNQDIQNILNLFQGNATPDWRLKINSGAFHNWWGTPNTAYLPSGNPGAVTVTSPTGYTGATLAACSSADKPPVGIKTPSGLIFEVEVFPPQIGSVSVPIQTQIHPTAKIVRQDNPATTLTGANFVSVGTRTVNGVTRTVFRFTNSSAFPINLQRVPAMVQVDGITDVFSNVTNNILASQCYDLNSKNDLTATGFNDTASPTLLIDSQSPVVSNIVPAGIIGRIPANTSFKIIFDEPMNQTVIPTFRLATTTQTLSFSYSSWISSTTVEFKNNIAFDSSITNGTWTYEVSNAKDEADNSQTGVSSTLVQIRTDSPEVQAGNIHITTRQDIVDPSVDLTDNVWSTAVSPGYAVFKVKYDSIPTKHLPHYLALYDSLDAKIGDVVLATNLFSTNGTATFNLSDFDVAPASAGPLVYSVKIIDSAANVTGALKDINFDTLPPDIAAANFANVGSTTTSGITYYSPINGNFTLSAVTASTNDELRLAIRSTMATSTLAMTHSSALNYTVSHGVNLANGSYTLTIIDAAGNPAPAFTAKEFVVDNARPNVVAITPSDLIGNCGAGAMNFRVAFSEPMDASAVNTPVLQLATSTAGTIIPMTFVKWEDPDLATTAVFMNTNAIDTSLPTGTYTYRLTGGVDLAQNSIIPVADGQFNVEIMTKGPFATIYTLTDQTHIYGPTSALVSNGAFNPAYGNGSATIRIDYPSGQFSSPHTLGIYDAANSDNQVATYAIPLGDPVEISFTGASGTWNAVDGTYKFKILDGAGNLSGSFLPTSLVYDTIVPDITAIKLKNSNSIATVTAAYPGLAWYYSPVQASATFEFTTTATDSVKLIIGNTLATISSDLTAGTGIQSGLLNSALADGPYFITCADSAGNMATGIASTAIMIVDTVSPTVTSVSPGLVGGLAAGVGTFSVTFSEPMNTASAPTLMLSTGSATIPSVTVPMTFVQWSDGTTCRFTNTNDINSSIPPGTYSFQISNAIDVAGNKNTNPATGTFEIELFTTPPAFSATLRSQQAYRLGNTEILNAPFSPIASPTVATLSVSYNQGPFQVPHSVLVYDATNAQVASIALDPGVSNAASVTVNAAFFGTPGLIGPATYSFKLLDNIGNLSATCSTHLVYDAVEPEIQVATITTVSDASTMPLYYNPSLHGNLNVAFQAVATDQLILIVASGTATHSYVMETNYVSGKSNYSIPSSETNSFQQGLYYISAFDLAGNPATGTASVTPIIFDWTAPSINSVVAMGGLPLSSSPAGQATFTVTFNEAMNQLASAVPNLTLATTSRQIVCTFTSWLSPTQAQFVTAEAITTEIPQGDYSCAVRAFDVTGNVVSNLSAATISIRSRGPAVSSFKTSSFQSTTASSATEILTNAPFSFAVSPNAATMSIQLQSLPDSLPTYLHFTLADVTVASYVLALDGNNAATFTWSTATGPAPIGPTTYVMKLADGSGDFSIENFSWTMDASAPSVLSQAITGGETATAAVYFNPGIHGVISARYSAVENESPLIRVRGTNSTDTYQMAADGTNYWIGAFNGRYSRGTDPKAVMPDGTYVFDMVDRAGNVALLASGSALSSTVIIDTKAPGISTYSLLLAGNPVTTFSPSGGTLEIGITTPEILGETGIYWIEVLNSSDVRIKKLPILNVLGNYKAYWDGTNTAGSVVIDGIYKFRALDYTGNKASGTASINAITSRFKITGINQISSTSVKIWMNHPIDATSIAGANISTTGLTVSNIALAESQALTMNVSPAMSHQTSYTFTIATGTLRSIHGALIAGPENAGILVADGQGPKVSSVSFEGLSGQQEFKLVFDELFSPTSASNVSNYSLVGPSGAVSVVQATPQSDQKTVLITAASSLIENASYTIFVTNVQDKFGNPTPTSGNSYSFVGRDLTPPVLEVSAFSNPANEYDIIVVVTSNEKLQTAPSLQIAQSNASVVTTAMQAGAATGSYMIGVHLSPSYPGNGTLVAYGKDAAGNQGTGNSTFTVAYLSANVAASVKSQDNSMLVVMNKNSLKKASMLKILEHKLQTTQNKIIPKLQEMLRASSLSLSSTDQSELSPISEGYEIDLPRANISGLFSVEVGTPATYTTGMGLFKQNGDKWDFVSASRNKTGNLYTQTNETGVYAILLDGKAPEIKLSNKDQEIEEFNTARPEFTGTITDNGSGVDATELSASIDNGPSQPVRFDGAGNFWFKPMSELTGGDHELVISAVDKTGNRANSAAIRFAVIAPLSITQIMQYPNPARRKTFIRISANRNDINEDFINVRIYDSAGHKVKTLNGIRAVRESWGVNSRFLYDIPWDLSNDRGKTVSNGVYFAKVTVRDPDNPSKKIKRVHKLAVLR